VITVIVIVITVITVIVIVITVITVILIVITVITVILITIKVTLGGGIPRVERETSVNIDRIGTVAKVRIAKNN
jgi:hypothetical protein